VFLVGVISTNVFGKRLIAFLERGILKIPVFKGFYTALKQLVDAFSPENRNSFKKFVIVEYPKPGTYAFGFLTKECLLRSERYADLPKLNAVYIQQTTSILAMLCCSRRWIFLYKHTHR